jgi:hypothetical protein
MHFSWVLVEWWSEVVSFPMVLGPLSRTEFMLTADDIHDRVRLRPFRPLRIVTSSGETYDVYHPDLIMVGRREITVGIPIGEAPTYYDRQDRIAIMHITALHDLPMPPPPPGNGQA